MQNEQLEITDHTSIIFVSFQVSNQSCDTKNLELVDREFVLLIFMDD